MISIIPSHFPPPLISAKASTLSARRPGGEGSPRAIVRRDSSGERRATRRGWSPRGRRAHVPVFGAADLTLPCPTDQVRGPKAHVAPGPLPLPPERRRGAHASKLRRLLCLEMFFAAGVYAALIALCTAA